jgi:acyl transferase domain-containing protein/NADP-dependent 3-hydroxy acid dehydrogenase YdfG
VFVVSIAIVGMSCRFPEANHYDDFWRLLVEGKSAIREAPEERWRSSDVYDPEIRTDKNSSVSKWGGFIDDVDKFDASFFNISALEAESLDPQHRLVLELAWHCIEDAGYDPQQLKGKEIGVFLGSASYDYKEMHDRKDHLMVGHEATGLANSVSAGRISCFFDWHGPSLVVDTACSSSLVAINSAISAIENNDCEAALVGGVQLILTSTQFMRLSNMGMLSPTGELRAFDENADGFVRGEGGGFIYLKSQAAAQRDGDNILAVIKSSAVNHGGKAKSLTSPNALAQSKVITSALMKAKIAPSSISYIEAHGTGTPMGDPIEFIGLSRAFRESAKLNSESLTENSCAIGAVKSNIGHLEPAAGIAGVIKVILAFKHDVLPKNANLKTINSRLKVEGSPFYFLRDNQPWPSALGNQGNGIPRRAGVSSFGYAGTNGHVILEEPMVNSPETPEEMKGGVKESVKESATTPILPQCLVLSAQSKWSLRQQVESYIPLFKNNSTDFYRLCATINQTRSQFTWRLAIVADSALLVVAALEDFLQEKSNVNLHYDALPCDIGGQKIAFMYTGQGSQYPAMGRALFEHQPIYREAFLQCDHYLSQHMDCSMAELLYGDNGATTAHDLNQTQYTQPALFAFEYALSQFWLALGVKPQAVIGHSIGEIVAACIAGVFSLADAAQLVMKRAQAMGGLAADGAMLVVMAPENQVREILEAFNKSASVAELDIAAINADDAIVLSGLRESIEAIDKVFVARKLSTQLLNVSQAFHSRLLDPVLPSFRQAAQAIDYAQPVTPLISNVTGERVTDALCDADYWVDHIRQPVLFKQGISALAAIQVDVLLELGPQAHLSSLAKRTLGDKVQLLASNKGVLKKGELKNGEVKNGEVNNADGGNEVEDIRHLLHVLASLYLRGATIDFSALQRETTVDRKLSLPSYPFDRQSYWMPGVPAQYGADDLSMETQRYQLPWLGNPRKTSLGDNDVISFETLLPSNMGEFLSDHKVYGRCVVPAAAYVSLVIAATSQLGLSSVAIKQIAFSKALVFEDKGVAVQIVLGNKAENSWEFSVLSTAADYALLPLQKQPAWEVCASGTLEELSESAWLAQRQSAIEAPLTPLQSTPLQSMNPADVYQRCMDMGLEYGNDFQAMQSLMVSDNRVEAYLRLPHAVVPAPEGTQTLHPVLLDAAFHSLAAIILTDGMLGGRVPLPMGMDTMTLFSSALLASPISELRVRACLRQNTPTKVMADIELVSMEGQIIASIVGLQLSWVSTSAFLQQIGDDAMASLFYSPHWVKQTQHRSPSSWGLTQNNTIKTCIIFSSASTHIQQALMESYSSVAARNLYSIEVIGRSQPESKLAEAEQVVSKHWYWDGASQEQLVDIVSAMPTVQRLIYIAEEVESVGEVTGDVTTLDTADTSRDYYPVHHLYRTLQGFVAYGYSQWDLSLVILSQSAKLAIGSMMVEAPIAAAVGLARSVVHEYDTWGVQHIHTSQQGLNHTARTIKQVNKLIDTSDDEQILCIGNDCYTQHYAPLMLDKVSDTPYRKEGLYVIFGGAGGVGLALAEDLIRQHGAKVALVGRSLFTAERMQIIDKINSATDNQGALTYYQADIVVLAEVNRVMALIQQELGQIHGVIHSAAVIEDSAFENMDSQQLNRVLAPKVLGGRHIAASTEGLALDFMLLFSSSVSQFGTAGQCNYVAANAFIDSLAIELNSQRNYPVKVIDWGFWGETGVASDNFYHQAFAKLGVGPLQTYEGIEAIHRVLASGTQQHVVIKAEDAALQKGGFKLDTLWYEDKGQQVLDTQQRFQRQSFILEKESLNSELANALPSLDELYAANDEAMSESIVQGLATILQQVLRLDVLSECGTTKGLLGLRLTSLGIDSLTTADLRAKVQAWLSIDLPAGMVIGGGRVSDIAELLKTKLLLNRLRSENSEPRGLTDDNSEDEIEVFTI